jgi:hypothetical protein
VIGINATCQGSTVDGDDHGGQTPFGYNDVRPQEGRKTSCALSKALNNDGTLRGPARPVR